MVFTRRLIFLILILGVGTAGILWLRWPDPPSLDPPTPPQESTSPPPKPQQAKKNTDDSFPFPPPVHQPMSLLLIGVDQRSGDQGRADALMLLTIHPDLRTVKVLNIPRDSKTRLWLGGGKWKQDKINHSYSLGTGIPSTVKTVEHFLEVPIHHYVKVNFSGFRSLVDLFGGVDVQVKSPFSYKGHHFKKGAMTLNGSQALAYVRDRTGGSDYDRHERQQQVMKNLWKKGTRWSTLLKMDDLYQVMHRHVKTSLSLQDTWQLFRTLRSVEEKDVEVLRLSGSDQWTPRYYLVVPKRERLRVGRRLKEHLELKTKPVAFKVPEKTFTAFLTS